MSVVGTWDSGVVGKALRYWSEGPGIDPRSLEIFSGASCKPYSDLNKFIETTT